MKDIAYSKDALRTLSRVPRNLRDRIRAKIRQYAEEPESMANNVRKLQGMPYIRLRVGDWRIIMDDQGNVLQIVRIAPRGSAYE